MKIDELLLYLKNLIKNKMFYQSVLFYCSPMSPCRYVVIEVLKALHTNDLKESGKIKRLIEIGNFPDSLWIEPDGGVIKIDTVRDIKRFVLMRPMISERKSVVINMAEKMNREAQNSFLKILEEPPLYANFLLLIKEEGLLDTIVSRCFKIKIPESEDYINALLKRKALSEGAEVFFNVCGVYEDDDIGDKISEFFILRDQILRTIESSKKKESNFKELLKVSSKGSYDMLLKIAISIVRDILALKVGEEKILNYDVKLILKRMPNFSEEILRWKIKKLFELKDDYLWNVNFELFLIKFVEVLRMREKEREW